MASTDSELNELYPKGLLPGSAPSASDRDANGILTEKTVNNIVIKLKSEGIIPTLQGSGSYESFVSRQETLINNIKAEYDFYESKYETALNNLFNSIREGYDNNTTENITRINNNLTTTQNLNKKLNDLTQIINGITGYMLSSTSGLETQIRTFDNLIRDKQDKLQKQNRIITSSQATTELNKEMVKFTEQKSKYSNNLLGLYSFLNVVALGLLVYVYKSSRE